MDQLRGSYIAADAYAAWPGRTRGRRALAAHHDGFLDVAQIHGDVEAKRMLAVYLEPANRGREPACINFQPVHPIGEGPNGELPVWARGGSLRLPCVCSC